MIDPDSVVIKFCEQCGIPCSSGPEKMGGQVFSPHRGTLKASRLIAGLHFLEQATLLPINKLSFPTLFLHGKDDSIISELAGRYFCTQAGGTFVEFKGPHAFFMDDPAAIAAVIAGFTERHCNGLL